LHSLGFDTLFFSRKKQIVPLSGRARSSFIFGNRAERGKEEIVAALLKLFGKNCPRRHKSFFCLYSKMMAC
jgi:hypothetical protein